MTKHKMPFVTNEYYHIWNRGVDKRDLFSDYSDINRFVKTINGLNSFDHVNKLLILSSDSMKSDLVEIVSYCINKNHYHFILKQKVDGGISKFMHKFSTSYTNYFNAKEKRSGSLFQGRFKSKHIDSNEYLLWLFVYVNLNNYVHLRKTKIGSRTPNSGRLIDGKDFYALSSWSQYDPEYKDKYSNLAIPCNTDLIIEQFISNEDIVKLAENTLPLIINRKILLQELENDDISAVNLSE